MAYPIAENTNLTAFVNQYLKLKPNIYTNVLLRRKMIELSNLTCVYWSVALQEWDTKGCSILSIDNLHIKCKCTHLSAFSTNFFTPTMSYAPALVSNSTVKASPVVVPVIGLEDVVRWPLDVYFANLAKVWEHSPISFINFVLGPGFIVLGLFWAMYLSSLIYYSGSDDLKRGKMTKAQNRDDLAELKDDVQQHVWKVVRDLIVRDFLN